MERIKDYIPELLTFIQIFIKNSDDAKDVHQNALIKIYSRFETFDAKKGMLKVWLYQICKNEAFQFIRGKNRVRDITNMYVNVEVDVAEEIEVDKGYLQVIYDKIIVDINNHNVLQKYGLCEEFIMYYSNKGNSHITFKDLGIKYNMKSVTLRTVFHRVLIELDKKYKKELK